MKRFVFSLALAALLPLSAHAGEYRQVDAGKSSINFSYQQMGVKMEGRFRKFAAQFDFDPAKPAAAKASFEVDLASVDAGSGEASDEVVGKSWLNVKAFPTARFVAGSVKALGNNHFEVAGKLSIKGRTQDIRIPVILTPQGNTGVFDGSFTIRRGDFAIGEGAWAAFDIVANDIPIRFHITANSGK